MASVPTTSQLHTKTLERLSWPWLIWIVVALFSLVGTFLVCLVVHHNVRKVQAAVAVRAVPQEETKPILPTHDYSYAHIPTVVSSHSLQSPEIPAWSLQGSYSSSADPNVGPPSTKGVTVRLEHTVEEDTDLQHFKLLQAPTIFLASRSPDALAQILDVCTTSDDGNTEPSDAPSPGIFSQFSSFEDISVSFPQSAGSSHTSPFLAEADPDILILGALQTIDAAAIESTTSNPSRHSILGCSSVPNPGLRLSEEEDVFYNPNASTEATRAYATRASRGPDITRSPAQIALMNELGLDYIDARIATVTGHCPSPASSQFTFCTTQLLSPRFAQQSSYRRPLSVPLIGFFSTSTRTPRQIEMEHSLRRGKPKIVSMPPRRFSQTNTSLLRQSSQSIGRPQTTTLSAKRRGFAPMKELVDNTAELWHNDSPLRIPLGPTTWQLS